MFSSSSGEIVERAWNHSSGNAEIDTGMSLFKDWGAGCREGRAKPPSGSVHGQMFPEVFLLSPAAGT